ncbi:recombination mediator RecR [Immundisolibacter sp.]|uniref:recombination mediator RecR n=1 Tax=Immundisolibacter sp. TaxID=1934948 RepID=UPI000EDE325D|nr:recombination protein RecR [Gammaproteobacteria bacterium]
MATGLLDSLTHALQRLPGVGPKSARRMAFHLLVRDRDGGRRLGELLLEAMERIGRCRQCRNLTEQETCAVCASPQRDRALLCVVESPADVQAIDQASGFQGLYYVLHGRLSPLDGIGPEELELDRFEARLDEGDVRELILATSPTVEGEATAHYIADLARARGIRSTRIAHGVPMGGELEFVDGGTLRQALLGRRDYEG